MNLRMPALPAALLAALLGWAGCSLPALAQSVERGRALYEARCSACHSVDENRTGPMHRGLLGRRAGSVPGFAYSPALAASQRVWTPTTLRAWLKDPEALIPGQAMNMRTEQEGDREDLLAYLTTLTPSRPAARD